MNTFRIAVPALAACLALSACAGQGSAGTTPDPSPTGAAPTRPSTPAGTTITGTISAGVEPGCLLLETYLLVGGPSEVLRPGAKVTITGRAEPDLMTTCQQGVPFRVETATPA